MNNHEAYKQKVKKEFIKTGLPDCSAGGWRQSHTTTTEFIDKALDEYRDGLVKSIEEEKIRVIHEYELDDPEFLAMSAYNNALTKAIIFIRGDTKQEGKE